MIFINISSLLQYIVGCGTVVLVFLIVFCIFEAIAQWKIFSKMGVPGFYGLIPFFNDYILFKKCWTTKLIWFYWIATLYVNCIDPKSIGNMMEFTLYAIFGTISIAIELWKNKKLSDAFGQSLAFSFGMIFLPFIFYPILGFSENKKYIGKQHKK